MTIYEDNVATLIISVKCSILHLNLLFCFFAGFTWTWTRTWTWVYLNPNLNLGTWYLSPIYRWRKNEKYEVWVHLNARFFTWTWRPVPGLAEPPCPSWAPASKTNFTSEKRQLDGVPTVVIQWERKAEDGGFTHKRLSELLCQWPHEAFPRLVISFTIIIIEVWSLVSVVSYMSYISSTSTINLMAASTSSMAWPHGDFPHKVFTSSLIFSWHQQASAVIIMGCRGNLICLYMCSLTCHLHSLTT